MAVGFYEVFLSVKVTVGIQNGGVANDHIFGNRCEAWKTLNIYIL